MSGWFESDDFWRIFGDCMFQPERFVQAEAELGGLVQLAGRPVARVLDLGCGPGRHALPFAATGVAVTGVDRSPTLLDAGRRRAEAAGITVEWIEADMRAFSRPRAFDLVLSMWTSFGYFDDRADDATVIRRCYENLAPGGTLIVDVAGAEIILRDIEPVHLSELDDGRILVERPLVGEGMDRYENEWLLLDGDRVHRAAWHHNLYSGRELAALLEAVGFVDVARYGSLDATPYDLEAERLVVVGRRPESAR